MVGPLAKVGKSNTAPMNFLDIHVVEVSLHC